MLKILLLILVAPSFLFAQGKMVEQIKKKYREVKSIHGELTQVYHWEDFDVTQSFEGELWLKRPDKLRLRLVDDQENYLICCADTAWLYTPGLNQAILSHHPSEALMEIFNFDHYEIDPKVDEECILDMVPQEENAYFDKITMHIDKDELLINRMILTDSNDNRTEWLFREIELNPELSDTLFHFAPPPDVEVIEQ